MKILSVTTIISPSTTMRKITAIRKVGAISGQMYMHIAKLKMRFSGARTAMRVHIMKASCTFVMSVVIRVTRLGTENLSMLEKEKVCTLL